jgi:hypothetical protein
MEYRVPLPDLVASWERARTDETSSVQGLGVPTLVWNPQAYDYFGWSGCADEGAVA